MRRVIAIAVAGASLAGCSSFSFDSFKSAPPPVQVQLESVPPGADATTSVGPGCKTPCSVAVAAPDAGFSVTFALRKVPAGHRSGPGDPHPRRFLDACQRPPSTPTPWWRNSGRQAPRRARPGSRCGRRSRSPRPPQRQRPPRRSRTRPRTAAATAAAADRADRLASLSAALQGVDCRQVATCLDYVSGADGYRGGSAGTRHV